MKLNNTQLDQLAVFTFIKDKNLRFVSCSENVAELAGEDSPSAMRGKDDFNLIWRRGAPEYQANEIKMIKGELKYVNILDVVDAMEGGQIKPQKILNTKIPIFDKRGLCIGISGSFVNVSSLEKENICERLDEKGRLLLPKKMSCEYITTRETQVLKCILLGYTAQQIAKELYISSRTVERHTENLKRKLQCGSKNHLHAAAVELGLTHMM